MSRHRRLAPLNDKRPQISSDSFVAPNATLVGDVTLGEGSAIYYGSVVRGLSNLNILIQHNLY